MKILWFQKGFNYARDGSGNRLVLHMQGCNLRCPWCTNPESMSRGGTLMVRKERLNAAVCPHGAVSDDGLDRTVCRSCTARECLGKYRNQGIICATHESDTDSLCEEAVLAAALFFDGGGVTLTGGEPTLQWEACRELLTCLRARGIHTAIETNATHPDLPALFPFIDQLIMDCKHYDGESHKKWTGADNGTVLQNLKAAFSLHPDVLVRIPLIGGVNASADDAHEFAALFTSMNPGNARFETLIYHQYGRKKWLACGMEYHMGDEAFVTEQTRRATEKTLREAGLTVIRT